MTLGDVCEILDNLRKPISKKNRISGDFPYYGATGVVDYIDSYIFDEKLVLIGEDGAKWTSGEATAFSAEGKYWVNNHAHVVRPNRDLIMDDWLILFLNMTDLSEHITGVTVPKLNQKKLRQILIPMPPLSVQESILETVNEALDNFTACVERIGISVNSIRELLDSKLQTVFQEESKGWEKIPFEKSILKVHGSPKIKRRDFKEKGQYPIISQEMNYVNGYWDSADDLLLIGSPVVVFGDHTKTLKYVDFDFVRGADGLKVLKPIESVHPKFFYHQLRSVKLESLGYARHFRLLKQVDIRVPSMELQIQIASLFDALDEQISDLTNLFELELESLIELKQSILQEAFNGNL